MYLRIQYNTKDENVFSASSEIAFELRAYSHSTKDFWTELTCMCTWLLLIGTHLQKQTVPYFSISPPSTLSQCKHPQVAVFHKIFRIILFSEWHRSLKNITIEGYASLSNFQKAESIPSIGLFKIICEIFLYDNFTKYDMCTH